MKILLTTILLSLNFCLYGQKQMITDTTYRTWSYIEPGYTKLSSNGKYCYYQTINKPVGKTTYTISSTDRSWRYTTTAMANFSFSQSGVFGYFLIGDTLRQINLESGTTSDLDIVYSYQLIAGASNEWLVYKRKNKNNVLVVRKGSNKQEVSFNDVDEFFAVPGTDILILKLISETGGKLAIANIAAGQVDEFYSGKVPEGIIFSPSGRKVAFYTADNNFTSIWYYDIGQKSAEKIADDRSEGIAVNHHITTGVWRFSSDNEALFFGQNRVKDINISEKINYKLWNYQDGLLRSQVPEDGDFMMMPERNLTILSLKTKKIRQLLSGLQKVTFSSWEQGFTDVLIVEKSFGRIDELPWNSYSKVSYYLLFTETGEIRAISEDRTSPINIIELSPNGQYALFYDREKQSYFSYEIKSGNLLMISGIDEGLNIYSAFTRNKENKDAAGIVGWTKNNHAIIQCTFNLWDIDVSGKNAPRILTKQDTGDRIIFSLLKKGERNLGNEDKPRWITGYNLSDKSIGLYNCNLNTGRFNRTYVNNSAAARPYSDNLVFIKAEKANSFLIASETAASSLNYSFTNNFTKFIKISDNCPEKPYNWIKSELVSYKDAEGQECEGILYKPENFDKSVKHPVLFHYYMDESYKVNDYMSPKPSGDGFNIPLLISKGYVVFWPNIYQKRGQPGESVLKSVLAAVEYLKRCNWADMTRLGAAGHSFGGYENNYVITHTNIFKAAYTGAGITNLVEAYNELWSSGFSRQSMIKNGPYGMQKGLEDRLEAYVQNSPIVSAKDVTTPLLLMHNTNDRSVPVIHSIQFFVQLRSLNKAVWLIQYANEEHTLEDEVNQLDFQQKLLSFFDYYLQHGDKSQWMLDHVEPIDY